MSVNAFIQSPSALGKVMVPAPQDAADTCSFRAEVTLTTAQNVANNVIEMCALPAGCVPTDFILDADDLDSNGAPTVTFDVGVLTGNWGDLVDGSGALRDLVNAGSPEIFSASNVAQAGGVARPTLASAFRIAEATNDRGVGIKIKAAAATATQGKIGLTILYRG